MNVAFPPIGIGSIVAIIVLVLAILFGILGQMDWKIAGLIGLLAVARLT